MPTRYTFTAMKRKLMEKEAKKTLSGRVDPGLIDSLEKEAQEKERSKSYILNNILKKHYRRAKIATA